MNISEIVKESISYSEVARKLGYKYINGTVTRKVKKLTCDCDCSHFRKGPKAKYKYITKICPICENTFEAKEGHYREKQTCSYSCSNIYFRSGPDNGNWKESEENCKSSAYRSTCFYYHKKKCVICGEKNIVEVHHLDENTKNNKPENLIPICSTHHQYWHSRFKPLVEQKILDYINNWKLNNIAL